MAEPRRLDDDDDLPALGFRDDAHDDYLRSQRPSTPKEEPKAPRKKSRDAQRVRGTIDDERDSEEYEYEDDDDEDDDNDRRQLFQLRRAERYPVDPKDWIAKVRMTQTEVSLRLAQYLIAEQLVSTKVTLTLAGYELTRREKPRFPIDRYLVEHLGFKAKRAIKEECRGTYIMKERAHALVINWDKLDGHLITRLTSGQRLVVFVSAGRVASSRSSAEHKQLRAVIGRALTWEHADAHDLLAVCVPRSLRYLRLASIFRETEGVTRARLGILTVDRQTGQVHGL